MKKPSRIGSALSLVDLSLLAASAVASTVASTVASNARAPLEIGPENLTLTYEAFDGTFAYPCKAAFAYPENPYDFEVRCYDGAREVKKVDLHLSLSRYSFSSAPRTKYEILFWVNGEGATSWLEFAESISMSHFESGMSIVGDSAELKLAIDL